MTDATPDWNSIPAEDQVRVARYEGSDGTRWSAGIWTKIRVGRHWEDREIAQAWGDTADEAITVAIEAMKEQVA